MADARDIARRQRSTIAGTVASVDLAVGDQVSASTGSQQDAAASSSDTPTAQVVVISTDEEYALFNVLGLRATDQALVSQNGHSFDRMTASNPKTNETVVYFFNIDKPFNWLSQSLKK